ncbi:Asp-tRNA(Asn)/Glu-tRNA(Gln) amidotransferase subunit GatB [Candidatus Uhrbacteria bacterium]|nr:Asp-tRNA(Asn)/Glu-tRNA(Gln) amidotransferase subunit GatB [Candidatus Uhrbacteria bacterium]
MDLEPIIGLEIHVQMKTRTKMFCGCVNHSEDTNPNTSICPVCTGHPGTLPVMNRTAIEFGVRTALALNCRILEHVKFDRKNYFYPDLPKGYQISMYDLPVGVGGHLDIPAASGTKEPGHGTRIGITRLHLEEDAAKLLHSPDEQWSFVDYNRAGTPLMEIVTEPDFRAPTDARRFLQELQTICRYLGVSDADMEKGHMRCDANVSLRPAGSSAFWPKTEIKNVNSTKAVERALEFEIRRQTKLWQTNTPPSKSTTRGWDDGKQATVDQREKEGEGDYRYFPEPDLPPLHFGPLQAIDPERARHALPELPAARRRRFVDQLGVSVTDVVTLTNDPALAHFTEAVISELQEWVRSMAPEQTDELLAKAGRTAGGWIASKLLGICNDRGCAFSESKATAENVAELLTLFLTHRVNSTIAHQLLEQMVVTGADPTHLLEEMHVEQVSDTDALTTAVDAAIAAHPGPVADYRSGKSNAVQFLVGQVMKATKGTANPGVVRSLLETRLRAE